MLNGRRPLAILGMLFASLLLIGVLGWQAYRLQESNSAVAESVLREYAILATDEFGRRLTAALGYRGYYPLISQFDDPKDANEMLSTLSSAADNSKVAKLAAGFFVFNADQISMVNIDPELQLASLLQSIYGKTATAKAPYHSIYLTSAGQQLIYALRVSGDNERKIFGFTVNPSGVSEYIREAFNLSPLLPASLAGGQVSNDLLYAEVQDPVGAILFEINRQFDSSLTISKVLGDDYQGVLEGFRIRVSVDPDAASSLVIGGLPESRLPILLFTLAMVIALMLGTIWMFRREQAVMALRSDFVSQVSHELRTPLTQIRMFAETLLLDRTRTDDERRRSLEIIDRESRRLSYLVDNLLRFSNISDAPLVDQHWQPLAPIVTDVCDTLRLNSNGPAIQLSVDQSVHANVDADALRQIVLNLLDNAVKYGPQQQEIRVSLTGDQDVARISVIDQGPGIPATERERVWAAFYRLKREDSTVISGTGIGLSIVRELVDAMGGHCWIDAAGEGTRVNIEFVTGADRD